MKLPIALLFALTALSAGCTVPTLDDLEPKSCDPAGGHECVEGWICVEGTCVRPEAGPCAPGETRACGTDVGECTAGLETCGDDHTWGVCEDEVAGTEESCNGLDDDCDDDVDEDLVSDDACELAVGVCTGARRACVNAGWETPCTAASYGPNYETEETLCDGRDNDCDGQTDLDPDGNVLRAPESCALTEGVCAGARPACTADGFEAPCAEASYGPDFEAVETTCDGLDNDCDGRRDVSRTFSAGEGLSGRWVHAGEALVSVVLESSGGEPTLVRRDLVPGAGERRSVRLSTGGQITSYALAAPREGPPVAAWAEQGTGGTTVHVARLFEAEEIEVGDGFAIPSAASSLSVAYAGGVYLLAWVDGTSGWAYLAGLGDGGSTVAPPKPMAQDELAYAVDATGLESGSFVVARAVTEGTFHAVRLTSHQPDLGVARGGQHETPGPVRDVEVVLTDEGDALIAWFQPDRAVRPLSWDLALTTSLSGLTAPSLLLRTGAVASMDLGWSARGPVVAWSEDALAPRVRAYVEGAGVFDIDEAAAGMTDRRPSAAGYDACGYVLWTTGDARGSRLEGSVACGCL